MAPLLCHTRRSSPGPSPSLQGGVFVIRGELDIATGPALARRLAAQRSVRVVDLSAVTFIDAAGLRWLREGLRRAPRRIVVRGISADVHRLLEIAALDDVDLTPVRDQRPPAALYWSTTDRGMRPRCGTATSLAPAHSRSCARS